MIESPTTVAISQKMRMVVNGGKTEVDSATLPIQFFFDEETVSKMSDDAYVVVIDQNSFRHSSYRQRCGEYYPRSLHKVSKGIKFLQINSAGKHHLVALLFCGEKAEENARRLLCRADGVYENTIEREAELEELRFESRQLRNHISAAAQIGIDVPRELFASQPEGWLAQAFWLYVNLWHHGQPTDECQYRKRMIMSIPKLPFALIVYAIVYGFRLVCAAIMALISLFSFYIGFKPENIWVQTVQIMKWTGTSWKIAPLAFEGEKRYRLWKADLKESRYSLRRCNERYMPVTGLELTLILLPAILWWKKLQSMPLGDIIGNHKSPNGVAILLFIAAVPGVIWTPVLANRSRKWLINQPFWKKFSEWWKKRQLVEPSQSKEPIFGFLRSIGNSIGRLMDYVSTIIARLSVTIVDAWEKGASARERHAGLHQLAKQQETMREETAFRSWVGTNFPISSIPAKVEIKTVPAPPRVEDRIVQKLYVSFWRLKGKVCRPFAR